MTRFIAIWLYFTLAMLVIRWWGMHECPLPRWRKR